MAEVVNTVLNALYSFGRIYFVCELGEKVTSQFNVFNEKISDCNWYLFSIETQRVFLIFLSGTQQLAAIQGYANTVCTRDAFKTVIFILVVFYVHADAEATV